MRCKKYDAVWAAEEAALAAARAATEAKWTAAWTAHKRGEHREAKA